ncbi:uncharacterized protein LOC144164897 [Haemaphysalis longicornis]
MRSAVAILQIDLAKAFDQLSILLPATEACGRRIMSSSGAAIAAQPSRGNRPTGSDNEEYQIILPQLPTGRIVLNTVFLHGDVKARPFKVEDFRDALARTGLLPEVVALGAYQINHVWAVTFSSAGATKKMLAVTELQVKGRRCVVIDPQDQQVRLKLHWLLHGVADDDIRAAFASYGKVTEVNRERWRVQGVTDKGSTTRTVLLKLKRGLKVDNLPHQIKVAGELALVVAPGRPMQCLRCNGQGHVRRDCKVPRCSKCRRFGHVETQCVPSYASVTGPADSEGATDHLMDAIEAEEAAEALVVEVKTPEATPATTAPPEEDLGERDQKCSTPEPPAALVGQHPEKMDTDGAATSVGTVKRSHVDAADGNDNMGNKNSEEPPAKTTQIRRPSFRPKPTIPPERKPPETPPQQLNARDSAAAGGSV